MPEDEIAIESRLSLIPAVIKQLCSDPDVRSRIHGREPAFHMALTEALANAIIHGNRSDAARKVYVRYVCEPDDALLIVIRDEGAALNSEIERKPREMGDDRNRGLRLILSSVDEIDFLNHGAEVHLRMKGRRKP